MRSSVRLTSDADALERVEEGPEVRAGCAAQRHVPTRDRGRDDERAGLDAIGDDVVRGAAQAPPALDLDRVGRRPLDLGAHRHEEPR